MSEDGASETTALVPSMGKPFSMPDFGNKATNIKAKLDELYKGTKLDIKNHVEREVSKAITRNIDAITVGDRDVLEDQKDLKKINAHIVAQNKKVELQRKIKHMGIHEAVLRKDEMNEKLRLLNDNIGLLEEDDIKETNESEEHSGDDDDPEANREKGRSIKGSRRSVDAIHNLEDKLGLPISSRHQRVMNFKDKMHISKDELAKSQQNAELFVNKMKEIDKERKDKKILKDKAEKNRTRTLLDKNSEERKQFEEDKKAKLVERIEKHKEQLAKVQETRQERESNWKAFKQKEKTQKYLHQEIQDRYKSDIIMPELERKKKNLESIRKFHKPIKREELDEHEKDYQEKIKIEREKQRMKREKWYSDIGYGVYDEGKYRTKFYDKVLQEEKQDESKKKVNSQTKKRKKEKMENYARIVKEMHWPQVSPKKRQEIEEIKQMMEQAPIIKHRQKFKSPRIKSSRYGSQTESADSVDRPKIIKKPNWDFHNPMLPKPEVKRQPVKVDWLGERRIKRGENNKDNLSTSQNWKQIAENDDLDDATKMQLLKERTRLLEENAGRKEQMSKVKGSTMESNVEVNEMLIDAIDAKLSLLDNFI
jgi:hypothetical protein